MPVPAGGSRRCELVNDAGAATARTSGDAVNRPMGVEHQIAHRAGTVAATGKGVKNCLGPGASWRRWRRQRVDDAQPGGAAQFRHAVHDAAGIEEQVTYRQFAVEHGKIVQRRQARRLRARRHSGGEQDDQR